MAGDGVGGRWRAVPDRTLPRCAAQLRHRGARRVADRARIDQARAAGREAGDEGMPALPAEHRRPRIAMRLLHEPARGGMRLVSPCGRSTVRAVVAIAGTAWVAACTDGGIGSGPSRRDSAGVEIVENRGAPAWTSATAWTVADTPSVSIGGNESDSTALFSRVQNAVRLGDGRIVVANGGTRELRFYDA